MVEWDKLLQVMNASCGDALKREVMIGHGLLHSVSDRAPAAGQTHKMQVAGLANMILKLPPSSVPDRKDAPEETWQVKAATTQRQNVKAKLDELGPIEEREWITVEEAAGLIGRTAGAVHTLAFSNQYERKAMGRRVLFRKEDILKHKDRAIGGRRADGSPAKPKLKELPPGEVVSEVVVAPPVDPEADPADAVYRPGAVKVTSFAQPKRDETPE